MAKYLIVASKFNDLVTRNLMEGAKVTFEERGIQNDSIDVVWVPGSFELPVVAAKAARSKKYAAVVCLGCVIRGETPHFDYVCAQAASGLMSVSIETETPVAFGVLTTDNIEQALSRCGLKGGNKGREAVEAVLDTCKALEKVEEWTN